MIRSKLLRRLVPADAAVEIAAADSRVLRTGKPARPAARIRRRPEAMAAHSVTSAEAMDEAVAVAVAVRAEGVAMVVAATGAAARAVQLQQQAEMQPRMIRQQRKAKIKQHPKRACRALAVAD